MHLAVVPVSGADRHTSEALEYAASLAPRVLAVHVRRSADATSIEDEWAQIGTCPPLIVLDAPDGDCTLAFEHALRVLMHTEPSVRITVVLPPGRDPLDWREALRCPTAVLIRRMPLR